MSDKLWDRIRIWYPPSSNCVVCGKGHLSGRLYTCSEECHQKFIDRLVAEFGEYKKVLDVETGRSYRVPTRDIIEGGLRQRDLAKYPEWSDEVPVRSKSNE